MGITEQVQQTMQTEYLRTVVDQNARIIALLEAQLLASGTPLPDVRGGVGVAQQHLTDQDIPRRRWRP